MSSVDDFDDDDIVDLLEVVSPGKKAGSASNQDADINAEIDGLLDAMPQEESASIPFPDPTPVDHLVDPDEELEMPSMDDLDDILHSLGASPAPKTSAEPSAVLRSQNSPDLDSIPFSTAMNSAADSGALDELIANSDKAAKKFREREEKGAGDSGASEMTAPASDDLATITAANSTQKASVPPMDDDFEAMIAAATKTVAAKQSLLEPTTPSQESTVPIDDDLAAMIAAAPKAAPVEAVEPAPAVEEPLDVTSPAVSLDAAALDASLDETLTATLAAECVDGAFATSTSPETVTDEPVVEAEYIEADDSGVDLEKLDALLDDMLATAPAAGASISGGQNTAPVAEGGAFPALAKAGIRMDEIEQSVKALAVSVKDDISVLQSTVASLGQAVIEATEAAYTAGQPQAPAVDYAEQLQQQQALIEQQQETIANLQEQITAMQVNMEKNAAEAAARVIREELAVLLQSL